MKELPFLYPFLSIETYWLIISYVQLQHNAVYVALMEEEYIIIYQTIVIDNG